MSIKIKAMCQSDRETHSEESLGKNACSSEPVTSVSMNDENRPEKEEDGIRAEAIRRLKTRSMLKNARSIIFLD